MNLILINDHICFKNSNTECMRVIFTFETDLIDMILIQEHSGAHIGINKMTSIVNKKYYGISKQSIVNFVNQCESCRNFLPLRTLEDVQMIPIAAKYERYIIDCVDFRKYSDVNDGYCWILNIIDSFTKFAWSYKLKTKSAIEVKDAIKHCFMHYGVPSTIQADNGKEFTNILLNSLCREMNVRIIHGRPRHPQSQGMIERFNQTIKRWMAKVLFGNPVKRWIDVHENVTYKYNATVNRSTNKSPFLLFFGKEGFNVPSLLPEIDEFGSELILPSSSNIILDENENFDGNLDDLIRIPDGFNRENLTIVEENQFSNRIGLFDYSLNPVLPRRFISSSECESNEMENINIEVLNHHKNYRERTIKNSNSNTVIRNFQVGDQVLLKKDFDNNLKTKRLAFDSFFLK